MALNIRLIVSRAEKFHAHFETLATANFDLIALLC
jgi:hypothetical protein